MITKILSKSLTFLFVGVLSLQVLVQSGFADERLPVDSPIWTYHTSPDYRPSEEHPLRLVSYVLHPFGWLLREGIFRPVSYLMGYNYTTRTVFGYREQGDYRNPSCFSASNAVPDCRSFAPFNYGDRGGVSNVYGINNSLNADNQDRKMLEASLNGADDMKGGSYMFPNVNFDFDSSRLNQTGMSKVQDIANILDDNGYIDIVLEGHTDNLGSAEYNNALGLKRAEAVRAELARLGVDDALISTVTFGESRPIASNDSELDRAQNRRVEVHSDK